MIYQILFFPCLISIIVLFILWWIASHKRDFFKENVAKLEGSIKNMVEANRTLQNAIVEAGRDAEIKAIMLGKIKEKINNSGEKIPDNIDSLTEYYNKLPKVN